MAGLNIGDVLKTEKGLSVSVDELLGEGGQGKVYKVTYDGKQKVLKMYKPESVKNLEWFRENLKREIKNSVIVSSSGTSQLSSPDAEPDEIIPDRKSVV